MSKVPKPSLSFVALNAPWSQTHPAALIRGGDLLLIAFLMIAWFIVLHLLFGGTATPGASTNSDDVNVFSEQARQSLYLSMGGYVCAIAGLFFLVSVRQLPPKAVLLNGFEPLTLVISIAVLFVTFFVLITLQTEAFQQPGGDLARTLIRELQAIQTSDPIGRIIFWFVVIFLKPLAFQLLFRGWIFSWLRMRMSFWFAALIASVLYASAQLAIYDFFIEKGAFSGAAILAATYVLFGYVSCALTEYAKSIWPGYGGDVIVSVIIF